MTAKQEKLLREALEKAIRIEISKDREGFKSLPWFVQQ